MKLKKYLILCFEPFQDIFVHHVLYVSSLSLNISFRFHEPPLCTFNVTFSLHGSSVAIQCVSETVLMQYNLNFWFVEMHTYDQ